MIKAFSEYFTGLGLQVTGNRAYGSLKGFEANISIEPTGGFNGMPCKLHLSFYGDDVAKSNIVSALENANIKYYRFQATPYGLLTGFTGLTNKKIIEKFGENLQKICDAIATYGGKGEGFCPVCGNAFDTAASAAPADPFADGAAAEKSVTVEKAETATAVSPEKCNIDGFTITLDAACADRINDIIKEQNKQFDEAPDNILRGTLGAVIGGVAGVVVAVIFFLLGFVQALSAVVSIVAGAYLYQKLGGKPTKIMIVIVSAVTIVFMGLSVFGIYFISAAIEGAEYGFTAGEAWKICMEDTKFSSAFYTDLALQLVFTVVGIVGEIYYMLRNIRRTKSIK